MKMCKSVKIYKNFLDKGKISVLSLYTSKRYKKIAEDERAAFNRRSESLR